MAPLRIVIIGGVACGPKAGARARRLDPDAQITIVEQGGLVSYAACGIPYFIGGQVPELEALVSTPAGIERDKTYFGSVKDQTVLTNTRVEIIDREKKAVRATNLKTGEALTLPYDKLVIAIGAHPIPLPITGADQPNVHYVWTPTDAAAIRQKLRSGNVKDIVVIGAGLIGLEVAESILNARGLAGKPPRVTVLEATPHITPALLDQEMAGIVMRYAATKHLTIRVSEPAQMIEPPGEEGTMTVVTARDRLPADLVLVAIGARPNVALARDAGLAIGTTGAIKVNDYLQTSDPDIYAGGDCVENKHIVTGAPIYTPLGSVANKHGRVIGTNLVGGRDTFPGVAGTSIYKVFDYTVGRTGLTERQAREAGFNVETALVVGSDHAHFYPGFGGVHIKLIVDATSRRILGCQIVGPGEVDKRLDVVVSCLHMQATIDHLASFDLAYSPPYNTSMDVLHHTANTARNKLDKLARTLTIPEMQRLMYDNPDAYKLVDVRTDYEFEETPPIRDDVVFIPLSKLREQKDRLPRDKTLVPYCSISMRAWEAQRILEGLGFNDVRFLEGGLASWHSEKSPEQPTH